MICRLGEDEEASTYGPCTALLHRAKPTHMPYKENTKDMEEKYEKG